MTNRQMAVRIGFDGKTEIIRDEEEIAARGEAAFDKLGAAISRATGQIVKQQTAFEREQQVLSQAAAQDAFSKFMGIKPVNTGTARESAAAFEAQLRQLDDIAQARATMIGQNFQTSLNAAMGIGAQGKSARDSASIFEAQFRAEDDMAARAARLRAEIDPLGAAQARYNAEIAEANTLMAANAISAEEQAAAHVLARQRLDATSQAMQSMNGMSRQSAMAMRMLSFQINDIVTGLAMGQSPFMILAQQGGQVYQVFSGTGLSVMSALKQIGGGIVSFLVSPLALAASGIAAVGLAAALGYSRAANAERQLSDATTLNARRIGATREELERIAEASAASNSISVAWARDIEVSFAKTGVVAASQLDGLIALTKRYARATGQGMDEARDAMTAAFADPARSGEKLLQSLGALDAKTQTLIERYLRAGDVTAAQTVLHDKLSDALKNEADKTTAIGNAWEYVKRVSSDAIESISRNFRAASVQEEKLALLEELKSARKGEGIGITTPEGYVQAPARPILQILADLKAVDAKIAADAKSAAEGRTDRIANDLSLKLKPIILEANQGLETYQKLVDTKKLLESVGYTDASGKFIVTNTKNFKALGMTIEQVQRAQEGYTHAVDTWIGPQEKARRLAELDLKALNDRTPAQKRLTAEKRREIEMLGEVVPASEAARRAQESGTLAYKSAAKAISDQTRELDLNARATLMVAKAWASGSIVDVLSAQARKQAMGENLQNGVDVDMRSRQILMGSFADRIENQQQSTDALRKETEAQEAANAAVAAGLLPYSQMSAFMRDKIALDVLEAIRLKAIAENQEDVAKGAQAAIDNYKKAAEAQKAASAQAKVLGSIDELKQQIALLDLMPEARAREEAVMRLQVETGQKLEDVNANNLRSLTLQRQEMERMNAALDQVGSRVGDFYKSLVRGNLRGGSLFSGLANDALDRVAGNLQRQTMEIIGPTLKDSFLGDILGTSKPDGTEGNPIHVVMGKSLMDLIGSDGKDAFGIGTATQSASKYMSGRLKDVFNTGGDDLASKLLGAFNMGGDLLSNLFSSLLGGGGGFLGGALSFLGLGGGSGAGAAAAGAGGFATGTDFAPGGWYDVGESGKERVFLPRGSRVLNHTDTMRATKPLNGAPGKVEVVVKIDGARGSEEIREAVAAGVKQAVETAGALINVYDQNIDKRVRPIVHDAISDPRKR